MTKKQLNYADFLILFFLGGGGDVEKQLLVVIFCFCVDVLSLVEKRRPEI